MDLRSLLPRIAGKSGIGWKPPLLSMMMAAAGISAIANAMASAAPSAAEPEVPTRLGTSIQQTMRERDQALAGQKRALELREQAQHAAEQRLQGTLQTGQNAPTSPTATTPAAPGQPGVYDELARIYQAMKPAKAAPIFEKLELDVQLEVARRMRERSTALLLASMSPDSAVELSMALAGRHVVKAPPPKPVAARPDAPAPARIPQGRGGAPVQTGARPIPFQTATGQAGRAAIPRARQAPPHVIAEQDGGTPDPAAQIAAAK